MSVKHWFQDIWFVLCHEMYRIFHDPGVSLIFFGAGLLYPIVYNVIYWNDDVEEVPIVVVEGRSSAASRKFIHDLDATSLVCVKTTTATLQEAKKLVIEGKVHGIVYFPDEFNRNLTTMDDKAHIEVYNDMSTFLYMKNVTAAVNLVMLDTMHGVQMGRYSMAGMVGESAEQLVKAVPYDAVGLYSTGGYSSFLIPAILIMAIHQTLLFGIGMLGGTAREENSELYYLPGREHERAFSRIILGRALAYFIIYFGISAYCLILLPILFHMPHVGNLFSIFGMIVPFLLATIFFCMTLSVFVRKRETGMVVLLPTTLVFVFIAGFSWPHAAMPAFWRYFSYIIPSTFGINAFIHINTMGATIGETLFEIRGLWIQSAVYLLTATIALQVDAYIDKRRKLVEKEEKEGEQNNTSK